MSGDSYNQLDILKHIEKLAEETNDSMGKKGKSAFRRYPLTFTILVLFGVVAVSEGVKGVLELVGFSGHPVYMLIFGLILLAITGTLYKKLDN